ncbi:uncharacterized protein LOC123307040 [Coccinella septempunctata]|uniref:uncharacterized protein LOC123307040 n=1 Tax=Coccinella septempunctata TaxID=41139 RepID=UPI001D0885B1|nr:uncharacterized protein LOC123307040 [Coccinella septempunctata]
MGVHLKQPITKLQRSQPPWKTRLERKINVIRKKIASLHTYLNTDSPPNKVYKAVRRIASELQIKAWTPDFRQKLETLCDKLKQRVKALGNRMKRYNERTKRYKINQLYYKNQKQFFRDLENGTATDDKPPKAEDMRKYWQEIWGKDKHHDDGAGWIREAEAESTKYDMENIHITKSDIEYVLKKTNNWAAPGPDKIHNYWWKYFPSTHQPLATLFQRALRDPSTIPKSLTLSCTRMIPKGNITTIPKNFRPITCLPTIYKILTGTITMHIWKHVGKHHILAREQAGCCKDAKGCKELLVIDQIITKQAKCKLRNISVA